MRMQWSVATLEKSNRMNDYCLFAVYHKKFDVINSSEGSKKKWNMPLVSRVTAVLPGSAL